MLRPVAAEPHVDEVSIAVVVRLGRLAGGIPKVRDRVAQQKQVHVPLGDTRLVRLVAIFPPLFAHLIGRNDRRRLLGRDGAQRQTNGRDQQDNGSFQQAHSIPPLVVTIFSSKTKIRLFATPSPAWLPRRASGRSPARPPRPKVYSRTLSGGRRRTSDPSGHRRFRQAKSRRCPAA